jgi:DNA excision repair protein ERCC-4
LKVIDSREQAPFAFKGYEVESEPATLPVGDYSLPGFQDRAAIERKELNDLISCLMNGNRKRFERELARGRHYDLFAVVVEASLAGLRGLSSFKRTYHESGFFTVFQKTLER